MVVAVAIALAIQTPNPAPVQSYAGTWTAELAGATYVRLELEAATDALRGKLSLGNMQVDKQGQVSKAENAPRESTPLTEVVRRDSHLSFSRKDGEETDHFQMRLLGPETAELVFLPTEEFKKELADAGIPLPKPIRLKKASR
ncbi:MAG TPA: hypothetical protein VES67_16385 [Vicinamibacterales bacterium]|nr:hypothetical protein [Vicinamibacterales bacterium]